MLNGMGDLGVQPAHTSATGRQSCGVSHPYFNRSALGLLNAQVGFDLKWNPPKPGFEAARRGLRFERKVVAWFTATYPTRFVAGLPFTFQTNRKRGTAVPDGLLFSPDWRSCCIVEVKLTHCADAWWQMEAFYKPIVQEALRTFKVVCLEVCKSYDPWVKLPRPSELLSSVEDVFQAREDVCCVMATRDGGLSYAKSSPHQTGDELYKC